jgi:V/A-type H+-transporting ATPase subunit E
MEKIQELTDKIRREGVEKGQEEAAQIIAQAKEQAAKIVADAKVQAEAIAAQAKKAAAELDQNTKSELKLYMGQAINALKSEITNIISDKVVAESVKKLTDDKDFLGKFTVALATEWAKQGDIVISSADAEGLKTYFAREAKALLDKGVKIEKVNGRQTLFTVEPADGSYRVDFGKEELENYFKNFLRPQLIEMLF